MGIVVLWGHGKFLKLDVMNKTNPNKFYMYRVSFVVWCINLMSAKSEKEQLTRRKYIGCRASGSRTSFVYLNWEWVEVVLSDRRAREGLYVGITLIWTLNKRKTCFLKIPSKKHYGKYSAKWSVWTSRKEWFYVRSKIQVGPVPIGHY